MGQKRGSVSPFVNTAKNWYGLVLPQDVMGTISAGVATIRAAKGRSCPVLKTKERARVTHDFYHIRKRCCVEAAVSSEESECRKGKFMRSHTGRRLLCQILNSNRDDEFALLKYGRSREERGDFARLMKPKEKWGMKQPVAPTQVRRNVFGRTLTRAERENSSVSDGYSREALDRLAFGDLKMYIADQSSFMEEYTQLVIKQLLVQSNTGVKYRTPIS